MFSTWRRHGRHVCQVLAGNMPDRNKRQTSRIKTAYFEMEADDQAAAFLTDQSPGGFLRNGLEEFQDMCFKDMSFKDMCFKICVAESSKASMFEGDLWDPVTVDFQGTLHDSLFLPTAIPTSVLSQDDDDDDDEEGAGLGGCSPGPVTGHRRFFVSNKLFSLGLSRHVCKP